MWWYVEYVGLKLPIKLIFYVMLWVLGDGVVVMKMVIAFVWLLKG